MRGRSKALVSAIVVRILSKLRRASSDGNMITVFPKSIGSDFSYLANRPLARFSRNGSSRATALILVRELLIFGDSFETTKISFSVCYGLRSSHVYPMAIMQ